MESEKIDKNPEEQINTYKDKKPENADNDNVEIKQAENLAIKKEDESDKKPENKEIEQIDKIINENVNLNNKKPENENLELEIKEIEKPKEENDDKNQITYIRNKKIFFL